MTDQIEALSHEHVECTQQVVGKKYAHRSHARLDNESCMVNLPKAVLAISTINRLKYVIEKNNK